MKRVVSVLLTIVMALSCVFAFAGCSKNVGASYELVYITDGASIEDGGYNKMAWNGVKDYGDEAGVSYRYYQPSTNDAGEVDTETVGKYVELATKNGAKTIVMQGEKMASAVAELAQQYKDTSFLLVGAYPHTKNSTQALSIGNVMTVSFNTLQAGFLAGYTAVAKGNDKLGYFGSVRDEASASYGAGYVQGAAYAADEAKKPVLLDYANYDADNLNYDYSFTIKPIYQKIEEAKEQTFKVNVVGGLGTGTYTDGQNVAIIANSPEAGKKFDHWEVKSDTDGVKDKKVNISSAKKSTMNLLVGDCDCTITAVWADCDTTEILVANPLTAEQYEVQLQISNISENKTINAEKETNAWVTAPAAPEGMVFDHWECNVEDVVEDVNASATNVKATGEQIVLFPIYKQSDVPTFNVTVEQGTGTGSYKSGDWVEVVADAPQDGYMFYKWENIDNQGLNPGVSMANEYNYNTSFEMVDRYSSIPETMYEQGTQVIFGGGNSQSISIFTATWNISHQVYGFGWGMDENGMGNCLSSVVTDYRVAVINALKDFKGGTNYVGDCANGCLYTVGMSLDKTYTDKKGNQVENPEFNPGYTEVYNGLVDGSISPAESNGDPNSVLNSKCLTLNYWVK